MVTYGNLPDAIVCNNNIVAAPDPFLEVFRLDTVYPTPNIATYHSYSAQDMQYDTVSGAWVGGNSDYDCSMVNLNDLNNSGTTTPYSVSYGGTEVVIQEATLSTDPVLCVLVAAILMLYAAEYVRRVFFS